MKLKSIIVMLLVAIIPLFAHNTLVPVGYVQYAATPIPDRIVLTLAENPSEAITVNWRTGTMVTSPKVQVAESGWSPSLERFSHEFTARTSIQSTDNGAAHHHSAQISGLKENTIYAYRVQGGGTWSEWFQFKTPTGSDQFSFLYFGDAQNQLKAHFSRLIRQAFITCPEASFMVHAGDLVNSREGNHDDEWAEWFSAGGWINGSLPSLPASGNHEHIKTGSGEQETYSLSPLWNAHFTLPQNGPKSLLNTVYSVDYQNVRFIVLNSQAALDGYLEEQTKWLEQKLQNNPNRWTIAVYHHPLFSVSEGRDNEIIRSAWKPLFDKYGVDLALQGHDHVYGRKNESNGTQAIEQSGGTVYVVSVSGPKMYLVSDNAKATMNRVGEDVQLFQKISVNHGQIVFESRTATGDLYDGFTIRKDKRGVKKIIELSPATSECSRPRTAGEEIKGCWSGSELLDMDPKFKK